MHRLRAGFRQQRNRQSTEITAYVRPGLTGKGENVGVKPTVPEGDFRTGKPCMLKCHVYRVRRLRPSSRFADYGLGGRQKDPASQDRAR